MNTANLTRDLADAVHQLAETTCDFSDADLEQPWRWRAHDEGVRFALIGAYHELCDLAQSLEAERARQGPSRTLAQRALASFHAAYRDLQILLLRRDNALFDRRPAVGEWAIRAILRHTVNTQRTFFTLVHYGLARQRNGGEQSPRLPQGEVERVLGDEAEFVEIYEQGSVAQMLAYFDRLHRRTLDEFMHISDEEIRAPSVWWEGQPYGLRYRLQRMDAHLRQHTVQVEKTLQALGQPPNEARRLLRLVYRALADVESALLGVPDLGRAQREALAQRIAGYAQSAAAVTAQARALAAAVADGDGETVEALLADNPELANAVNHDLALLLMDAIYRGHEAIAHRLIDAGAWLGIFPASALGLEEKAKTLVEEWPERLNAVSRDGFTPLQLACYFGRESLALWLMEQGADINAVAQNGQRIQPIHAAAACGSVRLVRALLARGADVNARQQQDFTPLHAAAQSGNVALAETLLDHGADLMARDSTGRTPADVAREAQQAAVLALLQRRQTGTTRASG
ncbi:MAG TPA: ankyrin repeat domain-containing protein [Candidatus Sulfomarinibacteraceae bacterium]|nr:ankyrin repeat domain-containing protein [Candidatus Sulfomarinibacteraceae bacterium]